MEPATSTSQQLAGVIDTGEESFSVDFITQTVAEKSGGSVPAEEKEVTLTSNEGGEEHEEAPKEEAPKEEVLKSDPVGVTKRIGKLTKARRTAERETVLERERRERVETELADLKAKNETLEAATEKPNMEDFDTDYEYNEALMDWKLDQREKKLAAEKPEVKEEPTPKQTQVDRKIQASLEKAAEKYPDFDKVTEGLEVPTDTLPVFSRLENAGDVAYWLGKNPDIADEISGLDAASAGAELQKISINLKPKKTTNAPKPNEPVSGTGGGIKNLEQMSQGEYNRARSKQEKERRGI